MYQIVPNLKFLLTTKGWSSLSIVLCCFLFNTHSIAQSNPIDLTNVNKIEKKVNQFKSLQLKSNPTKDDYLSYVNNLELEIDLRERLKNQYIILETQVLNNNINSTAEAADHFANKQSIPNNNFEHLKKDLANAVLKDKIFSKNLQRDKKNDVIRAIYLKQILNSKQTLSTPKMVLNNKEETQLKLDSLHAISIKRIADQNDTIGIRKKAMKKTVNILMRNTPIAKPTSKTNASTANKNSNSYSNIIINVQNSLRLDQIRNYNFKPDYASDNKLIEDRKGFIPSPLSQGKKAIRYEEKINDRTHDGIVFSSNTSLVKNISQGTVLKVSTYGNNNTYVIVRHDGEYMSVYTNLKKTYVKENQYIKFGESLGEAHLYKNDSYAIHFQLWKGSQSLNPSRWIKNN